MKIKSISPNIEKTNSSFGNYLIRTKLSGIGSGGFEWITNGQKYFMTMNQAKEYLSINYKLIEK
jgi:hypothetical protein